MMFIVWQVVLPITMIFIGGYAYSTLVNPDDINKTAHLSYPAFLTAGLIGYNVVWTCVISGNIILNDRINGMSRRIVYTFSISRMILLEGTRYRGVSFDCTT